MFKTVVVIPNWNGLDTIAACIDSLQKQSIKAHIIVVDNGSVDSSVKFIESNYPEIELIMSLLLITMLLPTKTG